MSNFEHPIKKVTAYVLEEWAMMMLEEPESYSELFNCEEIFFRAIANYSGVFEGTLTIICQTGFIESLTSNVLGMDFDEDSSREEQLDCLKEFANIISGNYLTEAYGDDTVFDLPSFNIAQVEYKEVDNYLGSELQSFVDRIACLYLADDHPVFVCFNIAADDYSA